MRVLFFLVMSALAHMAAARWYLSTLSAKARVRRRRPVLVLAAVLSLLLPCVRLVSSFSETTVAQAFVGAGMLELAALVAALVLLVPVQPPWRASLTMKSIDG